MQIKLHSVGLMIIISSPSGTGKTSLSKALIESDKNIKLSVSVTTRPPRVGEINNIDYHFTDEDSYNKLNQSGMLLEHANVYGYNYGTPKLQTIEHLNNGFDVLYDIDWQGAVQLKSSNVSERIVSIFILPPSMSILEERLRKRATDDAKTIDRRLHESRLEISKANQYDYVLVNDIFEETLSSIQSIIAAERMKTAHLVNIEESIYDLIYDVKAISETDISDETLIDVREKHEWDAGHIQGAVHIPLQQVLNDEFNLDKSKSYVIYCQHGVRSLKAAQHLKNTGFNNITHLKGGMVKWRGIKEK